MYGHAHGNDTMSQIVPNTVAAAKGTTNIQILARAIQYIGRRWHFPEPDEASTATVPEGARHIPEGREKEKTW